MKSIAFCCPSPLAALSRAAAKSASSRLRQLGLLPTRNNWAARAAVCEQCPLRVVRRGVSYCGTPFLEDLDRDPAIDGCGCPTRAKARDPHEHCPLDPRHQPATTGPDGCTCKWCTTASPT